MPHGPTQLGLQMCITRGMGKFCVVLSRRTVPSEVGFCFSDFSELGIFRDIFDILATILL